MVCVCMVRNCRNAKGSTKVKGCKLFSIPNDVSRCNDWLINCGRTDLISKPIIVLHKSYRVCNDHFKLKMYSNPEQTRLLPTAVPTEFESKNEVPVEKVEHYTVVKDESTDEITVTCLPSEEVIFYL